MQISGVQSHVLHVTNPTQLAYSLTLAHISIAIHPVQILDDYQPGRSLLKQCILHRGAIRSLC